MSNKLYTEEQVRTAFIAGMEFIPVDPNRYDDDANDYINSITPIELPTHAICVNCDEQKSIHSICMDCILKIGKQNIKLPTDEEIERESLEENNDDLSPAEEFKRGAKYVIDKIQGGNK